jgi:hypothetical protein
MLPKIAEGDANKVWIVPSEIGRALEGLGSAIGQIPGIPVESSPKMRVDLGTEELPVTVDRSLEETHDAVAQAIAAATESSVPPPSTEVPEQPRPETGEPPER